LPEVARQTASRLAALPDGGVQEIRRAFDATESNTLPAQLQYEADRQRELIDRDAFAEGVRAFLEKRAPDFRPR
jgi:2-(1,2-epoxy-1,2-dihydrophenyl)acetyl-CoA isomerase